MNADDLLKTITETPAIFEAEGYGRTTVHPITIFFGEGSHPSRTALRTIVVDGKKFLVQVTSL